MINRYLTSCLLLVGLLSSTLTQNSFGAGLAYSIDPNSSQITLSGTVAGFSLSEQAPGSLSTRYTGTINAHYARTSISFPGQSSIDAVVSGNWRPLPGGSDNSAGAPADYGAEASVLFGTARAALRDLVLDVTSAPLAINNGAFNAAGLSFSFPEDGTAAFDFNAGALGSGRRNLAGFTTNRIATMASISRDGANERITIPIDAEYKFRTLSDNDSVIQLRGTLVATRPLTPLIYNVSINNNVITIEAEALPNQTLRLDHSSDLRTWTPVNASDSDPSPAEYKFSTTVAGPIEFFRVVQ